MQRLISHASQIDQKPEVVRSVEICRIHVLLLFIFLPKETVGLLPKVLAFYSEPLTVTLTFVRLGLKYFSESLAHTARQRGEGCLSGTFSED